MSSSGMPPHASLTLSSTPSATGAAPDLDGAVGRGVPDRVHDQVGHHPGQPAGVGRHLRARPRRCRRAAPTAARATGSAPAIASLTRSPSATGSGLSVEHAGVDPGQLEQVVDHPHHPVDLGADLAVVARRVLGHAVLERLGHRPHARPAACAGRGRPTRPARAATPRAAPRAAATPPAARWCAPARPRAPASSLGPRARADERPVRVEPAGVLAQRRRPPRRSRAPTATATSSATDAGHRATQRDHAAVVRRDEHQPRDRDDAGQHRADGHPHDQRELPEDRPVADRPRQGQADEADADAHTSWPPAGSGARRWSRRRPPIGSRRPTPSAAGPAGWGRARSSRAAGARAPSPSTGRRTTTPTPARAARRGRTPSPGGPAGSAAGRTRGR